MTKGKALTMLGALAILIFPLLTVSHATLVNGDFSAGLTDWATVGDVTVIDKAAVLGDNNNVYSYLYQPVALNPLTYTIQLALRTLYQMC